MEHRVIAKARHTRPDGSKCKGAIATMQGRGTEPTSPGYSRWYVTADGVEVPTSLPGHLGGNGFTGWFADRSHGDTLAYIGPCPDCGQRKIMRGQRVNGTNKPSVRCDARCEGATGPNCECSCNGANHGSAHGA